MGWIRSRACVVAGFVLIVVGSAGCGSSAPKAKSASGEGGGSSEGRGGPAEVGKPAPDLSIQTVNGKGKVSLESLSGKVVVVDFWATWCGPCKQSFPKLEQIAKQNAGKVEVVGVSVDDEIDGVAEFAKENGATFAIGWDDKHAIANRWQVNSMPTTYILDASGTVRFIHAGYHDDEPEKITKELATLTEEGGGGASPKTEVASAGSESKPAEETSSGSATPDEGASASAEPAEAPAPAKPKKGGKGKGKGGGKKAPAKKGAGKKKK